MSTLYTCEHCDAYFLEEDIPTKTIKGSTEYSGGPPMEPDETLWFCPECDNVIEPEEADVYTMAEHIDALKAQLARRTP